MEPKKTPKADLSGKTFLFFNVGLIVALSVCIFAFTFKSEDDATIEDDFPPDTFESDLPEIPITDIPPRPAPVIVQPVFIEVKKDEPEPLDIPIDVDGERDPSKDHFLPVPEIEIIPEDSDQPFVVVEEPATPVGGIKAFYEFVAKKIKYPAQANRMGIDGTVYVEFIIERDGSITNVQAIKGIGGGCDQEAERILQSVPKWNPGKQRGQPVRQKMVLPIKFQIQ
jgi:periplasmic protein TonB